MSQSFYEIEKKLKDLEIRFAEIESLNNFLAKQVKEYYLLFDSIRRFNDITNLKSFFQTLDRIFKKSFSIDEYSFILRNATSDFLTIRHSMGLPKRKLREVVYRPNQGLVGKVYHRSQAVYIPDIGELKSFNYYDHLKKVQGSIYYLPLPLSKEENLGVLKLRKVSRHGFSEVERSVLTSLAEIISNSYRRALNLESLVSKSYLDELTGCYNRRYFDEHYKIEFKRAQRYQHNLSLIFIDVDDFKEINDFYGHGFGDYVLKTIGELLRRLTRISDSTIRYGGDEFLIILPETSHESALEVATKLKNAINTFPFQDSNLPNPLEITVSMGISSYPRDSIEPDVLVKIADQALYRSKEQGKNRISISVME